MDALVKWKLTDSLSSKLAFRYSGYDNNYLKWFYDVTVNFSWFRFHSTWWIHWVILFGLVIRNQIWTVSMLKTSKNCVDKQIISKFYNFFLIWFAEKKIFYVFILSVFFWLWRRVWQTKESDGQKFDSGNAPKYILIESSCYSLRFLWFANESEHRLILVSLLRMSFSNDRF